MRTRNDLRARAERALTLDTNTGAMSVSADAPAGGHAAAYRICEAGNAHNCDDASIALTVRAPSVIAAAADRATAVAGAGSVANATANDTRNGAPAHFATVFLSVVSGDEGLRFDAATGWVSVADSAVPGEHAPVAESGAAVTTYGLTVIVAAASLQLSGLTASQTR